MVTARSGAEKRGGLELTFTRLLIAVVAVIAIVARAAAAADGAFSGRRLTQEGGGVGTRGDGGGVEVSLQQNERTNPK